MKALAIALFVAAQPGCGGEPAPEPADLSHAPPDLGARDLATVDQTLPLLPFGPAVDYPLAPCTQGGVTIADLDGDGHLDLVNLNRQVCALLGNGDGTLRPAIVSPYDSVANVVDAVDLDHDGLPDLVLSRLDSQYKYIDVMRSLGGGSFGPFVSYYGGAAISGIAIGRFRKAGEVDLVTSESNDNALAFLTGLGDGTFQFPNVLDGVDREELLGAGDFTGDGLPDLFVLDEIAPRGEVRPSNGDGTFGDPIVAIDPAPFEIVVLDFDGDGRLDLAAASNYLRGIVIHLGAGDGTFTEAGSIPDMNAIYLHTGDFDGDGRTDLAYINNVDNGDHWQIRVIHAGPGGAPILAGNALDAPGSFASFVAGDLDGDGHADLVVLDENANTISVHLNHWK